MKGIVFSEFLKMVDEKFSVETTERVLDSVDLPSGGAYTSVGTYDHREMVALVTKLSEIATVSVTDLLKTFGRHLIERFAITFPEFFDGISSTFDFLPRVESYIHLEVRKLYEDAELPTFTCVSNQPRSLEMTYSSARNLPDLAEGLIQGVIEYFGESLVIERKSVSENPPIELFVITEKI